MSKPPIQECIYFVVLMKGIDSLMEDRQCEKGSGEGLLGVAFVAMDEVRFHVMFVGNHSGKLIVSCGWG